MQEELYRELFIQKVVFNMKFVSAGPICATADTLKKYGYRTEAYPFDYIFSSLELVEHCLTDGFNLFLDKQYYRSGVTKDTARHTVYNPMLSTDLLKKCYIEHNYLSYEPQDGNFFNHHNPMDNEEHYQMFMRRCERILKLINSNEKMCFVYTNSYTYDFQNILKFANYCLGYGNVFVLGLLFNDRDKELLHKGDNYVVYQNYDVEKILASVDKHYDILCDIEA